MGKLAKQTMNQKKRRTRHFFRMFSKVSHLTPSKLTSSGKSFSYEVLRSLSKPSKVQAFEFMIEKFSKTTFSLAMNMNQIFSGIANTVLSQSVK